MRDVAASVDAGSRWSTALPDKGPASGGATQPASTPLLLCRVRPDVLCGVPLAHVEETMRPLAVIPIAGVPSFVQGLAVVRGAAIPVVHAAALLCGELTRPTRFVTIKVGARRIALAVEAVLGVIDVESATVAALEPLWQSDGLDAVSVAAALDGELLLVLRGARLVPDGVWAALQTARAAA